MHQNEKKLTLVRLKKLFSYDSKTGLFHRRVSRGSGKMGSVAGCLDKTTGYLKITIDRSCYLAHRLAWFYYYEKWPPNLIDHIDRIEVNNWISNLRESTNQQNSWNSKQHKKKELPKGVVKVKNRFRAMIYYGGKNHFLGTFTTPEEASLVYIAASRKHHGEFSIFI